MHGENDTEKLKTQEDKELDPVSLDTWNKFLGCDLKHERQVRTVNFKQLCVKRKVRKTDGNHIP
jgi:hypothetical protein